MANSNEWQLKLGIHRGTITSRDFHSVSYKFGKSEDPLTSLEDCIECAKKWKKNYQSLGYKLYFVNAVSPEDKVYSSIIPF